MNMGVFWGRGLGHAAAASEVAYAAGKAQSAKHHAEEVEARLDRAMMACEAMWTLLRDKLGLTDMDLVDRMNQVDLSDGRLDGKVRKGALSCPKCSRTISSRFPKCMYCGQPILHDPFA